MSSPQHVQAIADCAVSDAPTHASLANLDGSRGVAVGTGCNTLATSGADTQNGVTTAVELTGDSSSGIPLDPAKIVQSCAGRPDKGTSEDNVLTIPEGGNLSTGSDGEPLSKQDQVAYACDHASVADSCYADRPASTAVEAHGASSKRQRSPSLDALGHQEKTFGHADMDIQATEEQSSTAPPVEDVAAEVPVEEMDASGTNVSAPMDDAEMGPDDQSQAATAQLGSNCTHPAKATSKRKDSAAAATRPDTSDDASGLEVKSTYRQQRQPDGPPKENSNGTSPQSYAKVASPRPNFTDPAAWRKYWYANYQRPKEDLPKDLILKALKAQPSQRRSCLPVTQTASADSTEFRIEAQDLTTAFPLAVIMASMHACTSPIWKNAVESLFGFQMQRGKGIRFYSNDDAVAVSLRNFEIEICGKMHRISCTPKYESYYSIQLHRVPVETTALEIFDFFVSHDCNPLVVYPTHSVGSLKSNAMTVLFNGRKIPPFLWSGKKEDAPLREISLDLSHPSSFVVHKLKQLNEFVPPSLQGKKRKTTSASTTQVQDDQQVDKPASAVPSSTASSTAVQGQDTAARYTTAPLRLPEILASNCRASSTSAPGPKEAPHRWHQKVKARVLPLTSEPPVSATSAVTPTFSEDKATASWAIPLDNRFEVLQHDFDDALPDFDVAVFSSEDQATASHSMMFPDRKRLSKQVAKLFHVDQISMDTLNSLIQDTCKTTLTNTGYGNKFLYSLQAQPALFRATLDDPAYQHAWSSLATSHALGRLLGSLHPDKFRSEDKLQDMGSVVDDYCAMFTGATGDTLTPHEGLTRLAATTKYSVEEHIAFALWDFYCMIVAPSIYFDAVKLAHGIQVGALTNLFCTKTLLWSDDTLHDWASSSLGVSMRSTALTGVFKTALTLVISSNP